MLRDLELRLSSPPAPHPRRSLPRQGKSPPSQEAPGPPPPQRGARGRVLSSDLPGRGRGRACSRPTAAPAAAGTAREVPSKAAKWTPGAGCAPPHRPPPPAPRSAFPAGFRLCSASRGSPFPGREKVRGGGSPSGVLYRHRLRCARKRGEPGWLAFLPSRGAARSAGRRTSTVETSGLGLDRWSAGARRRRRPGGATREGSRRATKWLGLDCCTFFFVRYIFRNKKKSPTLHTTSPASLRTRSPATAAWGNTATAPHPTTEWVGLVLLLGPRFGLQPEHYQNNVNCTPLYRYLSRL